jgi:hypothetical protein
MSLRIREDVDYPARTFNRAKNKIERIHINDPYRKGKVHKINLLVYDGEDRELVKLSVRKWLANLILNKAFDEEEEGHIYLKDLKDLNRIGPGLVIEVEDKIEKTHVLIWLD